MEPVPLVHQTMDHHKQHVFAVTTTNTSCWQHPYIVHCTKNILNFVVYLGVIQEILTARILQKLHIKQQDSKQQRSMPEEKRDLLHRRKMEHYQITLRMWSDMQSQFSSWSSTSNDRIREECSRRGAQQGSEFALSTAQQWQVAMITQCNYWLLKGAESQHNNESMLLQILRTAQELAVAEASEITSSFPSAKAAGM